MSEFKPIVSSNLKGAVYDPASEELIVTFTNGTRYKYPCFEPELYTEFQKTFDGKNGSAGSFFAKKIRFRDNEKIEGEDEA